MSFFACCRELYNVTRHSGCYGGTQEDAQKKFDAEEEETKKKLQEDNDTVIELAKALEKIKQLESVVT